MNTLWYQHFINLVKGSYNKIIVIFDPDKLIEIEEVKEALKNLGFLLHTYVNDIRLRFFLSNITQNDRVVIVRFDTSDYFPYDIEEKAELVTWKLKEIFPKLTTSVLCDYKSNLQVIYDNYKEAEIMLSFADDIKTRELVTEWLGSKKVRDKGTGEKLIYQEYEKSLINLLNELQKPQLDWLALGKLWGYLLYLQDKGAHSISPSITEQVYKQFVEFVFNNYNQQFFRGFLNAPATIDKILHYIAHQATGKFVLICFDGMSFQEWFVLREFLLSKNKPHFRVHAVFALIPTLTQFSRRALYNGATVINNLVSETKGFLKFCQTNIQGSTSKNTKLFLNAGSEWKPEYLEYEYVAIIMNFIDEIAHKSVLINRSKKLMQQNLVSYLTETGVDTLIEEFLKNGYRVFLTSDHGTVPGQGNGIKVDKYLVEDRAKRVLVYPNKKLAGDFVAGKNLSLYENPSILGSKVAIFPFGQDMFAKTNEVLITHGGITPDEVIIPFVEVHS